MTTEMSFIQLVLILVLMTVVMLEASSQQHRTSCIPSGGGFGFLSVHPSNVSKASPTSQNWRDVHLVGIPSVSGGDGILRVFLPGTNRGPTDYSCLLASLGNFLGAGAGAAVIGLSYKSWPDPDAKRNEFCSELSLPDAVKCLECQHEHVLFGGCDYNAQDSSHEVWPEVSREGSIAGRLRDLLRYLVRTRPAEEGWNSYLREEGDTNVVRWDRVWILGHSQGSGHAAYLAHKIKLAGSGLLSGPQDALLQSDASLNATKWWIDRPFLTKDIRAMSHQKENAAQIIQTNWDRMAPFLGLSRIISPLPNGNGPWLTQTNPQPNATCTTRPYHCSTALDGNAPLVHASVFDDSDTDAKAGIFHQDNNRNPYLYAQSIWPEQAGIDRSATTTSDSTNSLPDDLLLSQWWLHQWESAAILGAAAMVTVCAFLFYGFRKWRSVRRAKVLINEINSQN